MDNPIISVLIPIFNQSYFLPKALNSLLNQSAKNWEVIVINDGSTDNPIDVLSKFESLRDRMKYIEHTKNRGLGYSLNEGIEQARGKYISYLPADDVYFAAHLQTLYNTLIHNAESILAYSGLKYDYQDTSYYSGGRLATASIPGTPLQLVQVMHRKSGARWIERDELVTDDLDRMYWQKLKPMGGFIPTNRITAEWGSHPFQRNKIINEQKGGGIYRYKQFYRVSQPIKFQSIGGSLIDEVNDNKRLEIPKAATDLRPLKILLVGELAYNPQRILALEARGHKLYGLWLQRPQFYNAIGPLPFGDVQEVPYENWPTHLRQIKPDIIYAMLNYQAVPLAYEVLQKAHDIPFVWHFKESPFYCRQVGTWNQLMDLFNRSDGQIYINEETRQWFRQALHGNMSNSIILDGDLPLMCFFRDIRSDDLLSTSDGEPHTVISGRPFGLQPTHIHQLAKEKIHLHLYGEQYQKFYHDWVVAAKEKAGNYLHFHPTCAPENWTTEFSKYDAGWLHIFQSSNFGEWASTEWLDLNYPARMSTLAAAGIPMIQYNNSMHIVASQALTKRLNMGLFFSSFAELSERLRDREHMKQLRESCRRNRLHFAFDTHTENLINFFRQVILSKKMVTT